MCHNNYLSIYICAIRLSYIKEGEKKEPLAKKMREQESLGEGWDRTSPDKCREGKVIEVGQKKEGQQGPRKFSDLGLKQRKISAFLVA